MKRFITRSAIAIFGVAILMTALASSAVAATEFTDVPFDHPNLDAIYYLQGEKIVDGYEDGSYKPGATINRAEFLKIVMGAAGYEPGGEDCYEDVMDGWFEPYVCKASELELVEGYDDGTFKPAKDVNFAEASKIIAKVLDLEVDVAKDESWFHGFVDVLEKKDAIPATVTDFNKTLTRSEMTDVIWRIETDNVYELSNTYENISEGKPAMGTLANFESCDDLKNYIEKNVESQVYYYDDWGMEEEAVDMMPLEKSAAPESEAALDVSASGAEGGAEGGAEYSGTNVQVEGVDEADIVKNDGEYIYVVKDSTVRIVKAYPPEYLTEIYQVTFKNDGFSPHEMYVDGETLVVIGSVYDYLNYFVEGSSEEGDYYGEMTEVYVFDVSDKTDVVLERQLAFEGYYSSSRKVDDMLYLVSNKYSDFWWWDMEDIDNNDLVPLYADTKEDKVLTACACGDVWYPPSVDSTDYMVVAAIDLSNSDSEVVTEVVIGWSGNVYASRDNLYIAEPYWNPVFWDDWGGSWDDETIVHKFSLGEDMAYIGSGSVPGRTLNQFSMDEHNGFFRIATTKGQSWDNSSTNGLYILDSGLNVAGKVEGLAPGEEIYSARFLGDRAYMVTFKSIDPLFVIDVSEPTAPYVLGELKIPGFSDYLHPFGEDYLIGFGLDAEAFTDEDTDEWGAEAAWFQGVKLAMFDVSNVKAPVELHREIIGDRGTYSELSYNHKALLFDEEKGIMAFPITVAEIPQSVKDAVDLPSWTYGEDVFQGAYVYDVSVENGFELRGTVTHYDNFEAEYVYGWDYSKFVDRILYIGDYFYTVSQAVVQAHGMDAVDFVKSAELE